MSEEQRDRAAEEAAEWYLANLEADDEAHRRRFVAWLSQSPVHVEEYEAVSQLAQTLRDTPRPGSSPPQPVQTARAGDGANVVPLRPPARQPRPSPARAWLYGAAAAVGVVALTLFLANPIRVGPPAARVIQQRFSTAHGEQLTEQLADGSTLHLNTDSAVAVRFERSARWVDIERGQVVFDVAHDSARPFHVLAGSAEVVAVGTSFDVYLQGEATVVTVVEGRVTVRPAPALGGGRAPAGAPLRVSAGQMVRVVDGHVPLQPVPADPERTTAWLRHEISFENASLADVAREFNRYAAVPIEIETPALRERRMSGVFSATDTASFAAFLSRLDGVSVEVTASRIRVSQK